MIGIIIYLFTLVAAVVVLLKWNLSNLEKIEKLKNDLEKLNLSHNSVCEDYNGICEENERFKELLDIQNKIIKDLEQN